MGSLPQPAHGQGLEPDQRLAQGYDPLPLQQPQQPPATDCKPPEAVDAEFKAAFPAATVMAVVVGQDATRFMEVANALPPVTRFEADRVAVYRQPRVATYAALLFYQGCFVTWLIMDDEALPKALDAARGGAGGMDI